MRVCNGRIGLDKSLGKFTCYTYNGESVVDYFVCNKNCFNSIINFQIHDFTIHSNHAPLSFDLKCMNHIHERNYVQGTYCKWNSQYKDVFLTDILNDIQPFCDELTHCIHNNEDTDILVDKCTAFLTGRGNKYFLKRTSNNNNSYFQDTGPCQNKQWFNDECKRKHMVYIKSLQSYNSNKSAINRLILHENKKDFKYCCRKSKRNFMFKEASKLINQQK